MSQLSRVEERIVHATIAAPAERCFAVATDLEAYPDWAHGITSVSITERDDQGRPIAATFVAESFGRRTRYSLAYDLSDAPHRLSWSLVEGDLMRRIDGEYRFDASTTAPDLTDVTYELIIDLAVPLPGFVKRRAEGKIVRAALAEFCARVESSNP